MVKRIGIVGLGSIGLQHKHAISRIAPGVDIVVIRSREVSPLELRSKSSDVTYSLSDGIREGLDGAIVSSPATAHLSQARELLEAGIGLLIEKPLSNDLNEARKFSDFAEKQNAVCLLGYIFRYSAAAKAFKGRLNKDSLGKILHIQAECGSYLPEWRSNTDYRATVSARSELGGGVLLELSHEIDYLNWFFGPFSRVIGCISHSGTLEVNTEDSVDVIIRTIDGLSINLHLDFNRRHKSRRCVVQTETGELSWSVNDGVVSWRPAHGIVEKENFDSNKERLLDNQITHFLNCLVGHDTPVANLRHGLEVLTIVDAIRESDKRRKWVNLA
jgi:predicted dehydrogenase